MKINLTREQFEAKVNTVLNGISAGLCNWTSFHWTAYWVDGRIRIFPKGRRVELITGGFIHD